MIISTVTMKSLSIFAFLLVVLSLYAFAAGGQPILGGWQPIKDIKDPKVQKMGEFAVSEYNKESKKSLKFVEVVKGEKHVVVGMNYKLHVVAKEDSATKNYEAIVFVSLGEKLEKLVSFKPIGIPGGWQPIKDIKDPKVQKMGEFAVSEYNKESMRSLKFVEVVEGEQQEVAGRNYKLHVVAKEGSATKNYEAIVFVNLEETLEQLLSFKPIAGGRQPILGGWQPIENIKDPDVQKMGKFAVSEYNKESKKNLEFVEVVKGETQVVAGMKYRLHVVAKEGGVRKNYEAIVWVKAWENFEKLLSFQPIDGGRQPILGGWEPIENITDVQKMGEFAVSEYNKESNKSLKFVEVVKGEKQVVAGMNYKLNVVAKEDGVRKNYEAIVFVPLGENLEKLVSFKPIAEGRAHCVGCWEPIKNITDPVQKLGKFAVSEYNKESNKRLKFVEVVKAEKQMVAGMKYKLNLVAEEDGVRKNYEAIVWVKEWENFKKLLSFKPLLG